MADVTGIPAIKTAVDDLTNGGVRLALGETGDFIHTDAVYVALMGTIKTMEERLGASLENYQEHPDVQANLQQLQYDLQQWNLALTTMTNINKNLGDALNSIASNFR
jgi:hypothetical protein